MTEMIDSTNKLFNRGFLNLSLIPHATRWWAHFLFVLVVLAGYICTESTKLSFAQERSSSAQCQTTYSEECFSPQEKWAWEQIVQGKPVNMNDYLDDDQDVQPLSQDSKPRCQLLNTGEPINQSARTLSHKFIEFVATHPRYEQGANTRLVRIECAVVDGRINLSNKEIQPQLIIRNSLLKNGIDISDAHFLRSFTIEKSSVTGTVNSAGALFDRGLLLKENRHEQVILDNAQIKANLLVEDSTLTKTFSARVVDVGGDTHLMRTVFENLVDLEGAKTAGILFAKDSQFKGKFIAFDLNADGHIFLINSTFKATVNLARAKTAGILLAKDSQFNGEFKARNLDVSGNILLTNTTFKATADLTEAKTAGILLAKDSQFNEEFKARNLDVGGDMFLDSVNFEKQIILTSAKIGKQLGIRKSVFEKEFQAADMETGARISLTNTTFKAAVNLARTKTAGMLEANNSQFKGKFIALDLDAAGGIFLISTTFKATVDLRYAELGGTLQLVGSSFANELDLRQTRIANGFVLYEEEETNEGKMKASVPLWKEGAKLMLNDAHVGALQARMPESWLIYDDNSRPTSTLLTRDLHGFTYDSLHLLKDDYTNNERITRLIEWAGGATTPTTEADHGEKKETLLDYMLGKRCIAPKWQQGDTKYTPQPYTELAEKLREMGAAAQADRVLIARSNHYYKTQDPPWFAKAMGYFSCFVSHYGAEPFRPLYLFISLVVLGALLNFFAYKSSYKFFVYKSVSRDYLLRKLGAPVNFFAYKSSYKRLWKRLVRLLYDVFYFLVFHFLVGLFYYVFRPLFHSFRNSIPIPGFLSYTKETGPDCLIYLLYAQKIIGLVLLASALGHLAI